MVNIENASANGFLPSCDAEIAIDVGVEERGLKFHLTFHRAIVRTRKEDEKNFSRLSSLIPAMFRLKFHFFSFP